MTSDDPLVELREALTAGVEAVADLLMALEAVPAAMEAALNRFGRPTTTAQANGVTRSTTPPDSPNCRRCGRWPLRRCPSRMRWPTGWGSDSAGRSAGRGRRAREYADAPRTRRAYQSLARRRACLAASHGLNPDSQQGPAGHARGVVRSRHARRPGSRVRPASPPPTTPSQSRASRLLFFSGLRTWGGLASSTMIRGRRSDWHSRCTAVSEPRSPVPRTIADRRDDTEKRL